MGAHNDRAVLWFQHEFGIWPHSIQFVEMLKNLAGPKVVTFHTLHSQSEETPFGLRTEQHHLLRLLLPHVDAITVFSNRVHQTVLAAFPEHQDKVHIVRHGVHSYPGVCRLTRREAKEKLIDFLLHESDLDPKTKDRLYRQRVFVDPGTVVVGQTGFLSVSKRSEALYWARDALQQAVPHKRFVAVRIGIPRDDVQEAYAERLQGLQRDKPNFLLKAWLPQSMLPVAQRAFDINFYWPADCTQSGVLAHALGAGAFVVGRDLEGVGETLREAGQPVDTDLRRLIAKAGEVITRPELMDMIAARALSYAREFSWESQAQRHYELAERIAAAVPAAPEPRHDLATDTRAVAVTYRRAARTAQPAVTP
jgi:hypothetical protein